MKLKTPLGNLTLANQLVSGFHYLWRTVHGLRAGGAARSGAGD